MARFVIPLAGLTYRPAIPTLRREDTIGGFAPVMQKKGVAVRLQEAIEAKAPGVGVSFPSTVDRGRTAEEKEQTARAFARGETPARPLSHSYPGRVMVIERAGSVSITKAMLDQVDGLTVILSRFAAWRDDCYLTEFTDERITVADEPTAKDEQGIRWQKWAHGADNWMSARVLNERR